jgi:hypothetical protein
VIHIEDRIAYTWILKKFYMRLRLACPPPNSLSAGGGRGDEVREDICGLLEANIQHFYYESPGTDHEWQTWRRDLKDFASRLFQAER